MTTPITMYAIRYWRAKIEPVQVARLTAKTACIVTESGALCREHLRTAISSSLELHGPGATLVTCLRDGEWE